MTRKTKGTYLVRTKLVVICKRMQRSKYKTKVWLASDFVGNSNNRKYLETLVSLGLIERVEAAYNINGKTYTRTCVKGYRLI